MYEYSRHPTNDCSSDQVNNDVNYCLLLGMFELHGIPCVFLVNTPSQMRRSLDQSRISDFALLRAAILARHCFVVLPVFSLNHLAGKPTNNCSSGEPRKELNQFHLLSPFRVFRNPGFQRFSSANIGFERPLKKQLLIGCDWYGLQEFIIPRQVDAV